MKLGDLLKCAPSFYMVSIRKTRNTFWRILVFQNEEYLHASDKSFYLLLFYTLISIMTFNDVSKLLTIHIERDRAGNRSDHVVVGRLAGQNRAEVFATQLF